MPSLNELHQQRNDAFEAMQAIHHACETEDRSFKDDEQRDFSELAAKVDDLDKRIEVARRIETSTLNKSDEQLESEERAAWEAKQERESPESEPTAADRELAFRAYTLGNRATAEQVRAAQKCGVNHLSPEYRDLSVGTASAGGNAVPTSMMSEIERAMVEFGNVSGVARVITTPGGGALEMPTVTDTGNSGSILAENTADDETDPTFGKVTLNAYKVTSDIVNVSYEMLQDGVVDVGSLIGSLLGERLARGENALLTTGTGSSQHDGIVTSAADSSLTLAANTAVTYEELLTLEHAVDPSYRQGASWMFNDTIFRQIKEIADSQNRPLFLPANLQSGAPGTLLGYPVAINQDMASGSASKCLLFGRMDKFFVRRVQGVTLRRSDDWNFDQFQASFVAYLRSDSDTVQQNAIKYATAAS